jgi:hypothetical protein
MNFKERIEILLSKYINIPNPLSTKTIIVNEETRENIEYEKGLLERKVSSIVHEMILADGKSEHSIKKLRINMLDGILEYAVLDKLGREYDSFIHNITEINLYYDITLTSYNDFDKIHSSYIEREGKKNIHAFYDLIKNIHMKISQ